MLTCLLIGTETNLVVFVLFQSLGSSESSQGGSLLFTVEIQVILELWHVLVGSFQSESNKICMLHDWVAIKSLDIYKASAKLQACKSDRRYFHPRTDNGMVTQFGKSVNRRA